MIKWTNFERKTPHDKSICHVLVLKQNGDLEEELAIFYKELGTFVMKATEKKPCGTNARVVYWKQLVD